MEEKLKAFERLLNVMDDLREKCPWDKKQTIDSLRYLTIEETYELSDAIIDKDMKGIKEELGDLLLHMVFYAKIGEEQKEFDIADVLNTVCEKLIFRHPHIYGDVKVENEEDVKRNWEQLKLKEGKKSVLEGVPRSLPAMVKAHRLQEKVKQVGFEWDEASGAFEKLKEEIDELEEAQLAKNQEEMEKEIGDVLFSVINYARYLKIDADKALELTNKKFIARFMWMETEALQRKKLLQNMTLAEMDVLWTEAKKSLAT
ncbi:MAG: nucleoside triphosphate pyrophosphohydrolase [Chitinophagales bacterium]